MATNISPVISEDESMRRKRLREQHFAEERKLSLERFRQALVRGLKNLWNNLLFLSASAASSGVSCLIGRRSKTKSFKRSPKLMPNSRRVQFIKFR
jgi:hypothetical protein